MRLLLDTNVVLDVLLDRPPHVTYSSKVLAAVELGHVTGFVGATSITTIHYLAAKQIGSQGAVQAVEKLLSLLEVAPVTRSVLEEALRAQFADFEDAVLFAAAKNSDVEAIITRDPKGFKSADIPVLSPEELVAVLVARESDV